MQNSTQKYSKVLVTGANGFVGKALCPALVDAGYSVIEVVRQLSGIINACSVGDIDGSTDWASPLKSAPDCVIHLAACIQPEGKINQASLSLARKINTDGTLNLARQCSNAGVKRFIFLSTVKVLGEGKKTPYQDDDTPAPVDAYAISKWEAEQGLWKIAKETGMGVVVLRPVLVYGPGVKGNFFALIRAVDKGIPLPVGAINNRRSLLYVGNLIKAIELCINNPKVVGESITLNDGEDISTPELLRRIGIAMELPVRLLPVPVGMINFFGRLLLKEELEGRMTGSLAVDAKFLNKVLNWSSPYSVQEGLESTAKWYKEEQ